MRCRHGLVVASLVLVAICGCAEDASAPDAVPAPDETSSMRSEEARERSAEESQREPDPSDDVEPTCGGEADGADMLTVHFPCGNSAITVGTFVRPVAGPTAEEVVAALLDGPTEDERSAEASWPFDDITYEIEQQGDGIVVDLVDGEPDLDAFLYSDQVGIAMQRTFEQVDGEVTVLLDGEDLDELLLEIGQ